jgi:tRNA A37 threonylcarbamoyladenosine biosynthesis protein TsaE
MNTPIDITFRKQTLFSINWNKQAAQLHNKPQLQVHIDDKQYTVDNIELYVDSRGNTVETSDGKKNWYLTGFCRRIEILQNIAIFT